MLKGQKKHTDKEQFKTKHEAPRSVNYRATQNKNNIGTTALERSVVYTTGGGGVKNLFFSNLFLNKTCRNLNFMVTLCISLEKMLVEILFRTI